MYNKTDLSAAVINCKVFDSIKALPKWPDIISTAGKRVASVLLELSQKQLCNILLY